MRWAKFPYLSQNASNVFVACSVAFLYLYNFPYFDQIHSANELPRIYLTMAIVDRGALNIDPEVARFQPTPDTSSYAGRLYCNKAPGISFLTVPVYVALKWLCSAAPDLKQLFFWFRLFGSTVPSLLFLWFLWRKLSVIVPDPDQRRFVIVTYACGTMSLVYGTLLFSHQLSAVLIATGFLLALPDRRKLFWAGFAAGAACLVDYQAGFLGPAIFAYVVWTHADRIRAGLRFATGAAIPLIALLLYHWGCFDNPLKTGYNYPSNPVFRQWHSQGFLGLSRFRLSELINRHFSPDDGLFYYSPVLLLAFVGLYWLRKTPLRRESYLAITCIAIFVLFISSVSFVSGWDVGPRYVTAALPFYVIGLAAFAQHIRTTVLGSGIWMGAAAASMAIYLSVAAVFPHFPESFSNPLFDVTWRFGRAGYFPYNLGWLLGLSGRASIAPYAIVGVLLLASIVWRATTPLQTLRRRMASVAVSVGIMAVILGVYYAQLRFRSAPVPHGTIHWMARIWEPTSSAQDPAKLDTPIGPIPVR